MFCRLERFAKLCSRGRPTEARVSRHKAEKPENRISKTATILSHGLVAFLLLGSSHLWGWEEPSPERGLELLLEKPYVPSDFDQETFDSVWKVWPEPLRTEAERATPKQRRKLAYERYGLVARPDDPLGRPMQYVVDSKGQWTINCFACHQGHISGKVVPGMPNSHIALETLTEEIRLTKLKLGKPLSQMDLGSLVIPLGTTNGTTNAVMFGVALSTYRDADLNLRRGLHIPKMTHHDHDAPPWWNVHQKKRLYIDNFAPNSHRAIMQFLLVRENGPEKFREWEDDYRHIAAYIDSLRPPKFPHAIDERLAGEGKRIFKQHCADCHGTQGAYPERMVALEEVGTDPVRWQSLSVEQRASYGKSWFNHYGKKEQVHPAPTGYVAPPLDGVWASAPYFHNGSVPTLWHVLHPGERPQVWQRDIMGYDYVRVGLEVKEFDSLPKVSSKAERRTYFDTTAHGKSAQGHDFPDVLDEQEKRAVLEYLKTL